MLDTSTKLQPRSYNSAVFTSVTSNSYAVYSAKETSFTNSTAARPDLLNCVKNYSNHVTGFSDCEVASQTYEAAIAGRLLNLTVDECIRQYAVPFQSNATDLVLVSTVGEPPKSSYYYGALGTFDDPPGGCPGNPFSWICSGDHGTMDCTSPGYVYCPPAVKSIDRNDWKPFGVPVSYCLATRKEEQCVLQFTVPLAMVVVVFNLLKAATLFLVYFRTSEETLITIGDAVSSFVQKPDTTTRDICLLSRHDLSQWRRKTGPQVYTNVDRRCAHAVSGMRWFACLAL